MGILPARIKAFMEHGHLLCQKSRGISMAPAAVAKTAWPLLPGAFLDYPLVKLTVCNRKGAMKIVDLPMKIVISP